ncbi:MAG: flavin reductase family protein [Candidatus Thorarchaeota archaeon]
MSSNRREISPFDYQKLFGRHTGLLVSMDKHGKANVMALDWKRLFEYEGNPVIRVQVAYSRYTYKCLTEGVNEFTINIPSENIYDAVNIAGSYSGKNSDKIEIAGFEIIPGEKTQVPTLKDCLLNYECKIIHNEESNMSSHHYFYGKILIAYASNDLSKKDL